MTVRFSLRVNNDLDLDALTGLATAAEATMASSAGCTE